MSKPLTIRFTCTSFYASNIRALAEQAGKTPQEWVRSLVVQAIDENEQASKEQAAYREARKLTTPAKNGRASNPRAFKHAAGETIQGESRCKPLATRHEGMSIAGEEQ